MGFIFYHGTLSLEVGSTELIHLPEDASKDPSSGSSPVPSRKHTLYPQASLMAARPKHPPHPMERRREAEGQQPLEKLWVLSRRKISISSLALKPHLVSKEAGKLNVLLSNSCGRGRWKQTADRMWNEFHCSDCHRQADLVPPAGPSPPPAQALSALRYLFPKLLSARPITFPDSFLMNKTCLHVPITKFP